MQKTYLLYKLGVIALMAFTIQACKKANGIDNNTELQKPYSLYIGTYQGALLNTNSGDSFKTVFPPDGYASRALVTSASNIIWVKRFVHLSENNGKNFNPTYLRQNDFYLNVKPFFPWESMILSATDQNRVYVSSKDPRGIAYSDDNGKTWTLETLFDNYLTNNTYTSFTQLQNGKIFSNNLYTDSVYSKDNKGDSWTHVKPVTGLPAAGGHLFYLSHQANKLLLTDISGSQGAYSSTDDGNTWSAMPGLPNHILYATYAPFDQTILVGTDSMGVYRWDGNNFVPSNSGLQDYTVVYSFVAKEDIYKNGVSKKYVYAATNKGLYRSEDYGTNWTMVLPGSFVALY